MSTVELLNQLVENLEGSIKPTEIYNEGWMLKCVMEQIKEGEIELEKWKIPKGEMWLSETLVPSFFRAVKRGDKLAETATNADAIVGQIQIRKRTKWGIEIKKNCSCLYIIEAKMYSKLSNGVSKAPEFNQCARSVACLIKMIYDGIEKNEIDEIPDKIGFYVLLPRNHKYVADFEEKINEDSIKKSIKDRFTPYFNNEIIKKDYKEIKEKELNWLKDKLDELIGKIDVKLIFWEELIESTKNSETKEQLNEFYKKCQNPYSK
ncbi:MAG: hypothetical protein COS19_11165 [Flavobacteriaceae bacterium CG02_land_8_20_14_3_00_34_13]|nr:MAG: hypothetical protein COS19_11165 [Flavobacteriaceae bacterium CG02_land_8_20_14_3_00_34_13]